MNSINLSIVDQSAKEEIYMNIMEKFNKARPDLLELMADAIADPTTKRTPVTNFAALVEEEEEEETAVESKAAMEVWSLIGQLMSS